MTTYRQLGFLCKCGEVVPIEGIELPEGASLEGKVQELLLEGWQAKALHLGCSLPGEEGFVSPLNLRMVGSTTSDKQEDSQ